MENQFSNYEIRVMPNGKVVLITASIRVAIEKIKIAFSRNLSVLIRGGIGSGKSLMAYLAACEFNKCNNRFVRINISTISPDLLMSELFGHKKGSFSGSIEDRKGLVASAENGVLFIDEIGELTSEAQAALLDLLEEGIYKSVGADTCTYFKGKIILATHKKLELMVKSGVFREDLHSRIKSAVVEIPPIADNPEEIMLFADFFLEQYNKVDSNNAPKKFKEEFLKKIFASDLVYGIREIKGLVGVAHANAADNEYIGWDNPSEEISLTKEIFYSKLFAIFRVKNSEDFKKLVEFFNSSEKFLMEEALKLTGGVKKEAAKLCDLSRRAFLYKSKNYEIVGGYKNADGVESIKDADFSGSLNGKKIDVNVGLGSFVKWS